MIQLLLTAEADDVTIVNEPKDKIKFKINDQLFF